MFTWQFIFFSMIKTYLVHASKGINKNAWEFSLHILVVSKVLLRQPFKIWKYPQNICCFIVRPYLSNVLILNGFRSSKFYLSSISKVLSYYLYILDNFNGIQFLKAAKSLTKNQMIKSRCESLYLKYGRSRYIGNFYVYIWIVWQIADTIIPSISMHHNLRLRIRQNLQMMKNREYIRNGCKIIRQMFHTRRKFGLLGKISLINFHIYINKYAYLYIHILYNFYYIYHFTIYVLPNSLHFSIYQNRTSCMLKMFCWGENGMKRNET